jgi:hypothetical protein
MRLFPAVLTVALLLATLGAFLGGHYLRDPDAPSKHSPAQSPTPPDMRRGPIQT